MHRLSLLLLLLLPAVSGCNVAVPNTTRSASQPTTAGNATHRSVSTGDHVPDAGIGRATPDRSKAALECQKVDTGKFVVVKEQTFAFDYEPFRGSCFVTSKNPEYDGAPVESEFAIHKNGRKAFDFPNQFNGTAFGCWVEAVAFQDLNGDSLTDIIVVAKCSGKEKTYDENSVYINTGKDFITDLDANLKLREFSKVRDIVSYVKDHQNLYFKK